MAVDWSYYDKYEELIDKYMLPQGEGETIASQAVTAVNKLVYKWYNDGDVFDNTHEMSGWFNDLSSYANWLYSNMGVWCQRTLEVIEDCDSDDYYEELLQELADLILDEDLLKWASKQIKVGSIYKCEGPFRFVENRYDDEEDEYEEY